MTGLELITKERTEQIEKHGYTIEDDLQYDGQELIILIEFLLKGPTDAEADELRECLVGGNHNGVTFTEAFITKLEGKSRIEKLTIAGALLAAEIDRLQSTQRKL